MPTPNVIKVGLDGKKPIQAVEKLDLSTNLVITTITAYWVVEFDAANTDPTACFGASHGGQNLPIVGGGYAGPLDKRICLQLLPIVDPQSAGKLWRVQADFSNAPSSTATQTGKWEVKIEIDGVPITESYYFDLDGNQVTNSAGQNFSNQPSRTYEDQQIRVGFKTRSFDEESASELLQQLNQGQVTITCAALNYSRTFPAGTLRLDSLHTSPTAQAGQLAYWDIQIVMTYRAMVTAPSNCASPGGGSISGQVSTLEYDLVVDQGFAYIDSSSSKLVPFQDKDGNPCNAPGLLDGNGGAVNPNGGTITPSPDDAHYLAFRKAERGDFSILFAGIS